MKNKFFFMPLIIFSWLNLSLITQQVKPKIEFNSSEEIKLSVIEGISKFKIEFKGKNLKNEDFYMVAQTCDTINNINFKLSYLPCENCDISKLVSKTNRFYKLDKNFSLPVIFDFDLKHSNIFRSADGDVRIKRN